MKLGSYPGLDIAEYHDVSKGISKTGLALLAISPRTYRHAMDNKGKSETRSFRLGSGLHAAMEGTFADIYAVGPDAARNTKVWKEFEATHAGKICLKPDEAQPILAMKSAIDAYRPAAEILAQPGRFEVSYFWIDEDTGLLCKCRPDWISADQKIVVDFKTARDATHEKFQRAAYDLHYFVSAALTIEGVYQATGILPDKYIFLTIQSTAPHLIAAYQATADEIELGREFVRRNLALLKECQASGNWPGLPEEIQPLGLPRWAAKASRTHEEATKQDDLIDILEKEFADATADS